MVNKGHYNYKKANILSHNDTLWDSKILTEFGPINLNVTDSTHRSSSGRNSIMNISRIESKNYKSQQKQIFEENQRIIEKLRKQKSGLDFVKLHEERDQNESILSHLCRYPHIFK